MTLTSNATIATGTSTTNTTTAGTSTVGYSYTYPYTTIYPDYAQQISDIRKDVDDLNEIHDKELKELHKEIIPRPKDLIKNVWFNKEKGTVTVKWTDDQVTMIHCHEEDEFDLEKAIAICFMKKAYDNRGCFNEFLRKWLEKAVNQNKKKERPTAPVSKATKSKERFKTHMKKRAKKEKK